MLFWACMVNSTYSSFDNLHDLFFMCFGKNIDIIFSIPHLPKGQTTHHSSPLHVYYILSKKIYILGLYLFYFSFMSFSKVCMVTIQTQK